MRNLLNLLPALFLITSCGNDKTDTTGVTGMPENTMMMEETVSVGATQPMRASTMQESLTAIGLDPNALPPLDELVDQLTLDVRDTGFDIRWRARREWLDSLRFSHELS